MAATKRPSLRKNDRVSLAWHKKVIPPYDGKPYVLSDTVLTVSHLTGTGSKSKPWRVVVTDGTHFWTLEPDEVMSAEDKASETSQPMSGHSTMKHHGSSQRDLDAWLDRHGYRHERSGKQPTRSGHARVIHQEPTGRPVFAAHERDHHITTAGRRALGGGEFALPPGPEERRRGIKGRLPMDTIERARSALARASMLHHQGHLSASQLTAVRRKIHKAWPAIEVDSGSSHATTKRSTQSTKHYAFYYPKGRGPGSGWKYPKAYVGPFVTKAAAEEGLKESWPARAGEPRSRFQIKRLTADQFKKIWGSGEGH